MSNYDFRWLGGSKPKPAVDRFHSSYVANLDTGCWIWLGTKRGSNGYGRITSTGVVHQAHRFSWMLHRGSIPDGLLVCHKCDTPLCVNPDHLFLGTHQDNMRDCVEKGRTNGGTKTPLRGSENVRSKLTAQQVLQIRRDRRAQRKIAQLFGVSQALISKIKRNEMWRHI